MKRSAALLLVAALVAGGCGSGDQQEAVVSPASTQPAPPSTVVEIPTIVVPDFVGQTSEYARGVLDVLGLTIYIEESAGVSGEPDVVVRQLPAAGIAVTPGSLVMVTVPAPQIRKPTLGLSAAAEQLLSETKNLKAGHAATIRAASVLEQDPDTTHNPFAVIVKFEDGQTDEEIAASLTTIGGTRIGKPLGFDNLFLVETLANPAEAAVSLRSETAVEEVGLDYVVHTTDITNDPDVGKQWGLVQAPGLDVQNAWAITTGTAEVVVAVIDTGIQLDHPDLASNLWVNPGEIANNNIDDDNNGFIDDVHGWDFWNWDNDPDDDGESGHGTHVAGTIGAVINNGVGVSGIAPNVRLMALKVFNSNGKSYSNDIYSALEYAVTNGAQISNNSYGSYGENPKMGALIAAAARVGHVFVSAAGNDENNNDISPSFPASYPSDSIISVAASDQSGDLASFRQGGSNYGRTSVDVAAPGRDILSTINNSGYGWMSGTSMAAPHVTGLVALMRSIEPNLTSSAIREILIETSRPDSRLQNLVVSNGTVDAAAAVRAIAQSLIPTTTAPTTTRATPTTLPPTTTRATPTTLPPTTTRATPTTLPPTTTAGYTHPSRLQAPQVGAPYLYQSSNQYAVPISWNPPAQSGSSAVETYEISGSGGRNWTVSGEHQSITALNVHSGNQRFRVRAINFDNRAGDWSPYSEYVSVPTTTAPPTTTPLLPYYGYWNMPFATSSNPDAQVEPVGYRWDPCSGPVRIAMNPNGFLSQDQIADWESKVLQWAGEITQASGLAVVYTGQTDLTPRPENFWGEAGVTGGMQRGPVDILIYWGPPDDPDSKSWGTYLRSNDWHRGRTRQETHDDIWLGKSRWAAALHYDIHINTNNVKSWWHQPGSSSKYLMNLLGRTFGLASLQQKTDWPTSQIGNVPDGGLPDDFKTEIMNWGGWGLGTVSDPKWGPGDLIGFGLVGANNGCIPSWD